MIVLAAASLALAGVIVKGEGSYLLWSCAMVAGERANIQKSKDKFLFAFYFSDGPQFRSKNLVIAEGGNRLPKFVPSELDVGRSGDVHWLARDKTAISYRFDSLSVLSKGDFGTSYAKIEFFPRARADVIMAGECVILSTLNPKAALENIRSARLAK